MDPFTNRKVSGDQKKFVENAIILFKIFIIDKVEKIKLEYEKGAMTESEYNKKLELYNNMGFIEYLALPNPNDKLNKGGK